MGKAKPESQSPPTVSPVEKRSSVGEILIWLPSPMGDAILCTPALRAIRKHFKSCNITFFANPMVRGVLSPCSLNDKWLEQKQKNPFAVAKELKKHKFTQAILFKNSFVSALAVFLAGIPSRIGYAREGRGFLLTDKLYPPKLHSGKFKPVSAIDSYLAIASCLGCETTDRDLELNIEAEDEQQLCGKFPQVLSPDGPLVVLVPGGAFGPSKCWPSVRFAQTADWIISNYNATVVISVAPEAPEKQIAEEICNSSSHQLISLAETPVSLGELKALFSLADLVISNDTGPRHIAIAFKRKLITLFGPNNPSRTKTDYENEIQIIGNVPCAPCDKPLCKKSEHPCMQSITSEMVCEAAKELLENKVKRTTVLSQREFIEISESFLIDSKYKTAFGKSGLTSIDAIFSFNTGVDPGGSHLPKYRSRLQFDISDPTKILFLKRYHNPALRTQLASWLWHKSRKTMMSCELDSTISLALAGINTPKVVAYGEQWGKFLEKRSFIITEKIPDAEPLEERLPKCFAGQLTAGKLKEQRAFIQQLGQFARKFHSTGCRHRDFYLAHIFYSHNGTFYLIDLQRVFTPRLLAERFRVKDIAQLYYSAPGSAFSRTDRLRFYKSYTGKNHLDKSDKVFIRKVVKKVNQIMRHDIKHHRIVPFKN